MSSDALPVECIEYDGGRTLYVNSEFGPLRVCGTMDVFHSDASPLWGVFTGIIQIQHVTIPVEVHFKDTAGVMCMNVPIFTLQFATSEYACGDLEGDGILLHRIPGTPWCDAGRGLIVGQHSTGIIIALTQ